MIISLKQKNKNLAANRTSAQCMLTELANTVLLIIFSGDYLHEWFSAIWSVNWDISFHDGWFTEHSNRATKTCLIERVSEECICNFFFFRSVSHRSSYLEVNSNFLSNWEHSDMLPLDYNDFFSPFSLCSPS